ncbi:M28 family metallopeptidase [Frankia nepalensis]|uniref:M28 family metallopeptidase n=1 Tax=Frankia nepalensis TaxID=1836974 RepID=UPI001EE3BCE7|nr:M28 family peptidase [Frankia nepalensis]
MMLGRREFLGGTLAAAAAVTTGGLAGCGSGGATPAPAATPTAKAALPDTDTMMDWVEQVVARGVRRPGYAADQWAQEFVTAKFREFGLTDVHAEPVTVTRWEPLRYSLVATPAGEAPVELECFPLPFAVPADGLEVPLARFDEADLAAVAGRAALVDAKIIGLPPALPAEFGSAPKDGTPRVYDPDGTFTGETHLVPLVAGSEGLIDKVVEARGAAFIGALHDYPGDGCRYYFPYHGRTTDIPGVWIKGSDGRWLSERLARGPVQVRLDVATSSAPARSDNIVGDLPGPPGDDELVLVGSHHDGPWASAVEDGTGIAMVLAQAAYWAGVPAAERPHRMRFILQGGHMCGGAGLIDYVDRHRAELDKVVLEVHLEHAARDVAARDGRLAPTGRPTPRWFFTSTIPTLEKSVYDAIEAERLGRSMLLAPNAFGDMPMSDGAHYHTAGVPVVQFLAAPWYLFDEADTLDKVDPDSLLPIGRAAARIIESTRGVTAAQLRAGLVTR